MEKLIELLNKIYSVDKQSNSYCYKKRWYFKDECVYVDEATKLCNEFLISKQGGCDWDNIKLLNDAGFRVFGGEKDSFGWLTGCVQKFGDERILVFG